MRGHTFVTPADSSAEELGFRRGSDYATPATEVFARSATEQACGVIGREGLGGLGLGHQGIDHEGADRVGQHPQQGRIDPQLVLDALPGCAFSNRSAQKPRLPRCTASIRSRR